LVVSSRPSVQLVGWPGAVSWTEAARHFGISRTAARDLEIQNIINRIAGLDARHRLGNLSCLRSARAFSSGRLYWHWMIGRACGGSTMAL
jgi:hypothetical protein